MLQGYAPYPFPPSLWRRAPIEGLQRVPPSQSPCRGCQGAAGGTWKSNSVTNQSANAHGIHVRALTTRSDMAEALLA